MADKLAAIIRKMNKLFVFIVLCDDVLSVHRIPIYIKVESEAFERQSSPLDAYFLGKWCSSVEKMIKNTVALLVS